MSRLHRVHLLLVIALLTLAGLSVASKPLRLISSAKAATTAGASLPYVEVQAEDAITNGTIIGPDRHYPGLATEASGRRAVTLDARGEYVEFSVPKASNALIVRYSIPDNTAGTGIDAPIGLYVNGVKQPDLALTSRYGWFYGGYPFNNTPTDVRPHHFYDEVRRIIGAMPVGTKVRLQVDANSSASSYTIDLMDFEQVDQPLTKPAGYLSVTDFGADPTGVADSTSEVQTAVNTASSQNKGLWIPQGTFTIKTQIHINNVTIKGAGPWYAVLHFTTPTGSNAGLYGNYAPTPSQNVHLADFAILGEVVQRNDNDQINGIGGALSNSTIENLWIQHTKCGMWLDGPFDNLKISRVRIMDQIADGINFHKGVTNSSVTQSIFRNTGDDGLAMWSDSSNNSIANANNSFSFNHIEMPILANGIALYGGTNNSVTDNYVADQQAEGGGIHVGNRFSPVTPVSGITTIARNTVVRAGSRDYYNGWNFGTGAIWFFALDQDLTGTINVDDNHIIDSNYEAIHFIGNKVQNINFNRNQIIGAGTYAIEIRSSGSATFNGNTATGLGRGSIFSCRSDFTIIKGTGNSSWIDDPFVCPTPYPEPIYGPIVTPTPIPTSMPCPNSVCPPTNTPLPTATNTPIPTSTPVPTQIPGVVVKAINAGGSASGNWQADSNFNQGSSYADASTTIDTSGYLDPKVAPQAIYQDVRWNSAFNYTIPGLVAGQPYIVILHWAELSFQSAGARSFNVAINGSNVLNNFDVYAVGGYKRAVGKAFNATANASGQIAIDFSRGAADNPFISGIEIISPSGVVPTNTPVVPSATATNTPVAPTATRTPTQVPATATPNTNQTPYGGTVRTIPGTIQAEDFDNGGEAVAYHDLDAGNAGGQYRSTDVDIEASSEGGYNIGWIRNGEWLEYSVNVQTAGNYTLAARVASGVSTGSFRVEFNGLDKTGTVNINSTGGWQTWQDISRTVNLSAGQQVLRVQALGGDFNLNYLSLTASSNSTNLALNKAVTASSTNDVYAASNAVDGNATSYWESSQNAFPQSITVDLGASTNVSKIVLKLPANWGARNQNLSILGSSNNSSYGTLVNNASYSFDPATGNTVTINFSASNQRYIRINLTANSGWPSAQIAELEIY